MVQEVEISGAEVVGWLSRVSADDAEAILIGCDLDDGDADQLARIIAIDRQRNALVVAGGRRIPMGRLRAGAIVDSRPNAPLRQAISSSETPADRQQRQDRIELGRAGIDPSRLASSEDQQAVLALLKAEVAGSLPDSHQRHAGYMALRASADPALARVGARLFAAMAERFAAQDRIPADLYWRRASLLRTAGHPRDAVAVSDVLDTGGPSDPVARKFLATVRGAALLDLFDQDANSQWVTLAKQAVAVAMAWIPRDEEVWALDRRLRAAQRRLGWDH